MANYDAYIKKEWGSLIGRTITGVRQLTDEEMDDFGWQHGGGSLPLTFTLDNGLAFVPSQDLEGNGPGHIFVSVDPATCKHPKDDMVHEFDENSKLGDAYYCGLCGGLLQVG